MAGAYIHTPAIWPPLAGAIFLALVGLYSRRRRDVPAARWLAACSLITILWLLGIALEAAAVDPATKIAWRKFQSVWSMPAMAAVTCFVLEYVYPGRWLTRRNLALLWIPSVVTLLLLVLNGGHFVWRGAEIDPSGNVVLHRTSLGFAAIAYGSSLVLVNMAAFAWLFVRSPQHRWPVTLMVLAQIVARGLFLATVVQPSAQFFIDPEVMGIVFGWIAYAVALFGFRIFDPLPAARQAVLDQMHAGVVVFDPEWRVIALNPAAELILDERTDSARGKGWRELLPVEQPSSEGLLTSPGEASALLAGQANELPEMTIGSGAGARYYSAALSTLKDFRGLLLGHLLMLRDISEQKRAQAQIVEQQRSLAMLHERERLARDLHDSIGQVVGYAGLQVETAAQLIEGGRSADALAQLARLASVLGEAHAGIRQQILDLRATPSAQRPFFEVIQHYLHGFTTNYDIQTHLTVDDKLRQGALAPEAQIGLYHILQEALSNARRHGQARCVQVSFAGENGQARMSIEDDGCGFDLDYETDGDPMISSGAGHLGLAFMRERARELGGSLRIESARGKGTRLIVGVPHEEDEDARASG